MRASERPDVQTMMRIMEAQAINKVEQQDQISRPEFALVEAVRRPQVGGTRKLGIKITNG